MPRFASSLIVLLALIAAPSAQAAELPVAGAAPEPMLSAKLVTSHASSATCLEGLRRTAGSVAKRHVTLARPGYLYSTLRAASGDWDLAVYDSRGQRVSGGASPGAIEVASGYLEAGRYTLQACRLDGRASRAALVADFSPLPTNVKPEKTQLVSVKTPTRAAKDRLVALGLDLTEHGGREERRRRRSTVRRTTARLRSAGFNFDVIVADLVAQRRPRAPRRAARAPAPRWRPALPSGRTGTYRRAGRLQAEMKKLAEENPGLVAPDRAAQQDAGWARTVMGIEITKDVNAADGKPAFFNMGVHHAREWPAGEMPMEWAYELVNGYKTGDARAKKIVESSRNIDRADRQPGRLQRLARGRRARRRRRRPRRGRRRHRLHRGRRRRRRRVPPQELPPARRLETAATARRRPASPSRASTPTATTAGSGAARAPTRTRPRRPTAARRRSPSRRPATSRRSSRSNQVMSLITNHTTAALVLRAPGLASLGDPVDEDKGYKALGDEMAKQNGYFSPEGLRALRHDGHDGGLDLQRHRRLRLHHRDLLRGAQLRDGRLRRPGLPPDLRDRRDQGVDGDNDHANHANDPGAEQRAIDGKGKREAYYIAAESAINEERHSVIEGAAPAGATLRLPQVVQDGDLRGAGRGRQADRVRRQARDGLRRSRARRSSSGTSTRRRGRSSPRRAARRARAPPSPAETRRAAPTGPTPTTPTTARRSPRRRQPGQSDHRGDRSAVLQRPPVRDPGDRRQRRPDHRGGLEHAGLATGTSSCSRTPTATASPTPATRPSHVGATARPPRSRSPSPATPRWRPGKKYVLRVVNFAGGRALHGQQDLRRPGAVQGRAAWRAGR